MASKAKSLIGKKLKLKRKKLKLSLKDVSNIIKIKEKQLEAIENSNLNALPSLTYAVGFIRTYSKFLGLDSDVIVSDFKAEHKGETLKPKLILSIKESEISKPYPFILIISLIVAFLIIVLWSAFSSPKDVSNLNEIPVFKAKDTKLIKIESLNDILTETKVDDIKKTDLDPEFKVNNKSRIIIRAVVPIWIQVTNIKKKIIFRKLLKAGEKYIPPNEKGIKMVTANAGGTDIIVDGRKIKKLGGKGIVVRGILLDPDKIKENYKFKD